MKFCQKVKKGLPDSDKVLPHLHKVLLGSGKVLPDCGKTVLGCGKTLPRCGKTLPENFCSIYIEKYETLRENKKKLLKTY